LSVSHDCDNWPYVECASYDLRNFGKYASVHLRINTSISED